MLSKSTPQWTQLQSAVRVEGAAYREDFAGDISIPPDTRIEPDGGLSVKLVAGYNYHFWPPGRASIDPTDIAGMLVSFRARLVVDDPARPDDRVDARFIGSVGGDYWETLTAQWNNWTTNASWSRAARRICLDRRAERRGRAW